LVKHFVAPLLILNQPGMLIFTFGNPLFVLITTWSFSSEGQDPLYQTVLLLLLFFR
jgi:hypothetical protein